MHLTDKNIFKWVFLYRDKILLCNHHQAIQIMGMYWYQQRDIEENILTCEGTINWCHGSTECSSSHEDENPSIRTKSMWILEENQIKTEKYGNSYYS